ncbi:MAG: type II toxin-antitoxin system VapC family toxin [Oscillospiraceae bacterium]|nr:type II toxin-antitoxin system VapC family toxin [Oscillospiraceae bacterium]
MKILLDTHLLLWAALGDLPPKAVSYMEDKTNILLFSSASIWEVVIKSGLGREDFVVEPASLYSGLLSAGYQELPVTSRHSLLVATLPPLHKDPFDRILLAQSMSEGVPLLTIDRILTQYKSSVIYVG